MAGGIRLIRAIPGTATLATILNNFCKAEGVVTAFSHSLLTGCNELVPDNVPVEVVEFGKIVREFLVLSGESAPFIASGGHVVAAIAETCQHLPPDSPFEGSAQYSGTHEALLKTLGELADYEIDAPAFTRIRSVASEGLQNKIESLTLLMTERDRLLETFNRQISAHQVAACFDSIPELDGEYGRLLVFAGDELPPLKMKWLQWAASHGIDITLVVDRHAKEVPLFPLPAGLGEGKLAGTGNRLLDNLFAESYSDDAPIEVTVASTPDPLSECEWALRGCLEFAHSAIYVRNLESYAPLLEAASTRLGVPLQLWRRAPLMTNAYARITLQLVEFCNGQDVRKLSAILRSTYLGLDRAHQDVITLALRQAYRGRAEQWAILEAWADTVVEEYPWIVALLSWRKKARGGPYPFREWMGLMSELISADERWPWSTRGGQGDDAMRERDLRAKNRMEQLLADHASIAQAAQQDLITFPQITDLCARLWKHADVSVPSAREGVPVCNAAESLPAADTLFVLGMLEGVFPRRRSEDPVLTDRERMELAELLPELTPLPTSHDKSRRERGEFYKVCAAAQTRIVFSYPASDDQRDNIPAFYLEAVAAAAGECRRVTYRRGVLAPPDNHVLADFDKKMREALDAPALEPLPIILASERARDAIAQIPGIAYDPGQLQDALQCPFRFVVRNTLGVKVNRKLARWSNLQHLPQQAELAAQPSQEQAEVALNLALEALLDQLYSEIDDWETMLLRSGGERLIRDWLAREFRSREKWPKQSMKTNARFGEDLKSDMPGKLKVKGTVPATSELGRYNVAHVYRTSAPENKELSELERLYFGIHLLGLYDANRMAAVEVESQTGKRSLLVLGRDPGQSLPSFVQEGLQVIDLATHDDPMMARRDFYDEVRRLLKIAHERIQSGAIEATPGDHCFYCSYGELCRRSQFFSEEESLFGREDDPFGT